MPDESSRVFEVVCKGCSRSLMTVERLRDPERDAPPLGEVMRHVRVTTAERV